MNLNKYIENHKAQELAARWGVSKESIYKWKYGSRRPDPEVAKRMIRETKGELNYTAIYGDPWNAA